MNYGKLIRYLILLLLVGIALWQTYPYFTDLISLFRHRGLNYWWVGTAIIVQLLQYGGDGYLIHQLLAVLGFRVRIKDAVRISALDVFAIRFLPVGSFGSLLAFVYFYRKLGVSTQATIYLNLLLTVISSFVLAFMSIVSLSAARMPALPFPLRTYLLGAIAIMVPLLLAVLFVVLGSDETRQVLNQRLRQYQWYLSLRKNYDQLRDFAGVAAAQRVRLTGLATLKGLNIYLCDIVILFCCGLAFHATLPPLLITFAYVVAQVVGTISLTPGGLGTADATMTFLFLAGGVKPTTTLGVVLLNRIVSVLIPLPVGALAYFTLRWELDIKTATRRTTPLPPKS